jgi:hypothetical protein
VADKSARTTYLGVLVLILVIEHSDTWQLPYRRGDIDIFYFLFFLFFRGSVILGFYYTKK